MKPSNRFFSLLVSLIIFLVLSQAHAQNLVQLSLDDAINLARKQSPDALVAKNKYRASYWRYRMYKADYLPSLSANSTLADLNRSYSRITLPDGTDAFIDRKVLENDGYLSLNQKIGLTGGSVYLNTGLQRIEILNQTVRPVSYLSTPVILGLSQSINGYNALRWQKRIEPFYYQEAQQEYIQSLEQLSLNTVNVFFDVLLAQNNYNTAKLNRENNDTLYKIGQGRYNLGRIAENELLQLELNLLNAGLSVQRAGIALGAANAKLKTFLGLNPGDSLVLATPMATDTFHVSLASALEKAKQYNPITQSYNIKKLEADRDVAKTKGDNGLQGNLFAQYGLNRNAYNLPDAYKNPQDQEQFRFGINIPIVDWGKAKGALEMAKAQQQLTQTVVQQQQTDFEQNVTLLAAEFNLQGNQITIANKANDVGQRRYFIAKERYLLGKIGITDLNIAQTEKDAAQVAYIEVLRGYWASFFKLRMITLYDFKKDEPLQEANAPN